MEDLDFCKDLKRCLMILEQKYGLLVSGHTDAITCIDCSEDLCYVVTGSNDSSVRVWDGRTFGQVHKHHFHLGSVNCISISKDNQFVASGSNDKSFAIFSLKSISIVHIFRGHTRRTRCVKFSSDIKYLVTSSANRTVKVFNLCTMELQQNIEDHSGDVSALDINEKCLVTGDSRGIVRFWRVNDFLKFGAVTLVSKLTLLKLANNSQLFAVSCNKIVTLIDIESRTVIKSIVSAESVFHIKQHEENAYLFKESNADQWNLENNKINQIFMKDYEQVSCVISTQDFFFTGSIDRTVKLFDSLGNCKAIMHGHLGHIIKIKPYPVKMKIATSGDDFTIRFWDISKRIQENTVLYHKNGIQSLGFTKSGKYLMSICKPRIGFVWKVYHILNS